MSSFAWLQNWCGRHDKARVKIETLDNPGWALCLSLSKFASNKATEHLETSEDDWLYWRVKDGEVQYFGGARNLSDMLGMCKAYVEEKRVIWPSWAIVPDQNTVVNWLTDWVANVNRHVTIQTNDGAWSMTMDCLDIGNGKWSQDGYNYVVKDQSLIGHAYNGQLSSLIDDLAFQVYGWYKLDHAGVKESCALKWLKEWYEEHSNARIDIAQIGETRWRIALTDGAEQWNHIGVLPVVLAELRAHIEGRPISHTIKPIDDTMEHWLEDWFASQCDGYWEHGGRVKLFQTENGGWRLEADISQYDEVPTCPEYFKMHDHCLSGKGSADELLLLLEGFRSIW